MDNYKIRTKIMKYFDIIKSIENESIRNVLFIIFALIFALPLMVFFFVVNYYDLLQERIIHFSFVGYLIFSLLGLIIFRHITDKIISFANKTKEITQNATSKVIPGEISELKTITETFQNLIATLNENTETLGKRISELSALHELTEMTSKISDFGALFEIVLEKLIATTDSHSGLMLSILNNGNKMRVEASMGITKQLIPENEIDVNETIFGRVLKQNDFIVFDNPADEPDFNKPFDSIFQSGPCIAKAIKARGKVIAVLILSRGENGESFKDIELDYISTALGQSAFAISNAELIRELKNSCDELKEMQQKLITCERVAAINQTVVTLNDEINNPLTIIQGNVELIRKNFDISDEKFTQSLDLIEKSVQRCNTIMTKLRKIREPAVKLYGGMNIDMINTDNIKE